MFSEFSPNLSFNKIISEIYNFFALQLSQQISPLSLLLRSTRKNPSFAYHTILISKFLKFEESPKIFVLKTKKVEMIIELTILEFVIGLKFSITPSGFSFAKWGM